MKTELTQTKHNYTPKIIGWFLATHIFPILSIMGGIFSGDKYPIWQYYLLGIGTDVVILTIIALFGIILVLITWE